MKIITLIVEDGAIDGIEHFLTDARNGYASGMLVKDVKVEDVRSSTTEVEYAVVYESPDSDMTATNYYETLAEAIEACRPANHEHIQKVTSRRYNGRHTGSLFVESHKMSGWA